MNDDQREALEYQLVAVHRKLAVLAQAKGDQSDVGISELEAALLEELDDIDYAVGDGFLKSRNVAENDSNAANEKCLLREAIVGPL